MNNYFSKFASRAPGKTEPALIQPNDTSWLYKKKSEPQTNPFEDEGDFPGEVALRPFRSTEKNERASGREYPLFGTIFERKGFPDFHPRDRVSTSPKILPTGDENDTRPKVPAPRSFEGKDHARPSGAESMPLGNEMARVGKYRESEKGDSDTKESVTRKIHVSEKTGPDRSDSVVPKSRMEGPSLPVRKGMENEREMRPPSQLPEKSTILVRKETEPTDRESKTSIRPRKERKIQVTEILPASVPKFHRAIVPEKRKREERLVIGNLRVEVVTEQTSKAPPLRVREIRRTIPVRRRQKRSVGSSKLKFGMGQV